MKMRYSLAVFCMSLVVSSCSSVQPINTQTQNMDKSTPSIPHCQKKNPMTVSFYPGKSTLKNPYVVLGRETISKYNFVGIKRQEATIHDAMRNLAASMGGDAVIDIKHSEKTITGTVIAFDQKQKNTVTQG